MVSVSKVKDFFETKELVYSEVESLCKKLSDWDISEYAFEAFECGVLTSLEESGGYIIARFKYIDPYEELLDSETVYRFPSGWLSFDPFTLKREATEYIKLKCKEVLEDRLTSSKEDLKIVECDIKYYEEKLLELEEDING